MLLSKTIFSGKLFLKRSFLCENALHVKLKKLKICFLMVNRLVIVVENNIGYIIGKGISNFARNAGIFAKENVTNIVQINAKYWTTLC